MEKEICCSECKETTIHELDDVVFSDAKLVYVEIWDCTVCGNPSYIEK